MTIYEKAANRHFYEVEYGTQPGDHRLFRLFAEDDLDAIDRLLSIIPDAIIYDVYKIGK